MLPVFRESRGFHTPLQIGENRVWSAEASALAEGDVSSAFLRTRLTKKIISTIKTLHTFRRIAGHNNKISTPD